MNYIEDNVFGYKVERDLIPRPLGKPLIPMSATRKGVLHTCEGWSLKAALASLHSKHAAPHFVIGENRIIQTRPLGFQGAALIDQGNRLAYVQIECCGYTGGNQDYAHHATDSWQFVDSTRLPLVALMTYLDQKHIIPAMRAYPYPDDCSDFKNTMLYGHNNVRRLAGAYNMPKYVGWFYHLEVPGNEHYDCGHLRFAELIAACQQLAAPVGGLHL